MIFQSWFGQSINFLVQFLYFILTVMWVYLNSRINQSEDRDWVHYEQHWQYWNQMVITVAVLPIGQYSLLADSHNWSKSLKFGIDINVRSKILFYQLAKGFEVILPVGRRGCCFFMKCQIIFYFWRRCNKNNKFFADFAFFFAKYFQKKILIQIKQ